MELSEKINVVIRLTNAKHINTDLNLLRELQPNSRVLKRINNINQHNSKDIDEQIVFALLDIVDEKRIISNREAKISTDQNHNEPSVEKKKTAGSGGEIGNKSNNKTKRSPKELYPDIDWDNTDDHDIQLCMILFNDAVVQYNQMKALEPHLDSDPSLSADIVEADIRNKQAFSEIESFEKNKIFLWKHPILLNIMADYELINLYKNNSEGFLNQFAQAKDNIKRYKSLLKHKKYKDEKEKQKWQSHLLQYKNKVDAMSKILDKKKASD